MILHNDVLQALFQKYPAIRKEYFHALLADCRECELDEEERKDFVEQSIDNVDTFLYFMPKYQELFNKIGKELTEGK